jgi:putative transposase
MLIMPRSKRITKGNIVYHVRIRANGRLMIFKKARDFEAFEDILAEGLERFDMRMCGYCIMGNHWHLVLWPKEDGDLSAFMRWITQTHSQRWHASHGAVGCGHLYQGRYKSFPVQSNAYYLTLMRYVECNPLRAGLVEKAVQWPWSSLAIRTDNADNPITLCDSPVPLPMQWQRMVNDQMTLDETIVGKIEKSIERGSPLGDSDSITQTAGELGLESTIRPRGRPRKES